MSDLKGSGLKLLIFLSQYTIFCNQWDIVNGKALYGENVRPAGAKEFPYVVAIAKKNKNCPVEQNIFCTGALITRQDVLSAAHCLTNRLLNNTIVIAGSINVQKGKTYKLLAWLKYDTWAANRNIPLIFDKNDIAILRLEHRVSSSIRLGVLANGTYFDYFGMNVVTAGWGTMINNVVTKYLQAVELTVLTNNYCTNLLSMLVGAPMEVDITLFCTLSNPFALIVDGDSGGPLIFMDTIIAINRSTCPFPEVYVHPNKVNVHTCIEYYREFITYAINTPNQG